MKNSLIGWMLVAAGFVSCNDEVVPQEELGGQIGYSVNVSSNGWQAGTRAGGEDRLPYTRIEPLEQKLGGKPLYLHTVVKENDTESGESLPATTRGSISETGSVTAIGVSARTCNSSTWKDEEAKSYISNEKSEKSGGWATGHFWPATQSLIRFFAHAPYEAVTPEESCPPTFQYTVKSSVQEQTDLLVASAEHPGNYGKAVHLEFGHALTAVQFCLAEEVTGLRVDKISIEGVYDTGTYTYIYNGNGDADETTAAVHDAGTWSDVKSSTGTLSTFTLDFGDSGLSATNDNTVTELTTGENIFLMMPQTLPEEATIRIEGHDTANDTPVTLSANIGNNQWEKGKKVVYRISLTDMSVEYVLKVNGSDNPATVSIPYYGIKNQGFTVQSYKVITQTGRETRYVAVPWEVANQPTWVDELSATTQTGVSSTGATESGLFSAVAGLSTSTSHTNLSGATALGTATQPYDLSTNALFSGEKAPRNTANCYTVSAPGYYTLPLVYGNAITEGEDNKEAYMPTVGEKENVKSKVLYTTTGGTTSSWAHINTSILSPFRDHMGYAEGAGIEHPWIVKAKGGKYEAASAEIVWQDEPCLLTDVKLDATGNYLQFRVREDCICEGNAVVAVKDANGIIMWSWHIWVTDFLDYMGSAEGAHNFSNPHAITNRLVTSGWNEDATTPEGWGSYQESKFSIMRAHLGLCDGEQKVYTVRDGAIVFQQVENGAKSVSLTLQQAGATVTTNDNAPYYQFGRKDPMLPCSTNGVDKPYYNRQRKQQTSIQIYNKEEGDPTLGLSIRHPGKYFKGLTDTRNQEANVFEESWYDNFHINLWNANCTDIPMFAYYDGLTPVDYYNELKETLEAGVRKTVYDPCPPGYEVPRLDAFTGFTFDGTNVRPYWNTSENKPSNRVNVDGQVKNGTALEGLAFYTIGMPTSYAYSAAGTSPTPYFYIHALGHRNNVGALSGYNNFGSALTATPICVQWIDNTEINNYYSFHGARLCFIGDVTLRVISSSEFDLSFGIMPAKTEGNPSSTETLP